MENKSHALKAGLFAIILLVVGICIVIFMNRDKTTRVPYMIATTQSISGLSVQANVTFRGMDVGRVTSIEFNPEDPGEILIQLEVNKDAPMTKATYAVLSYQGVTGIASIDLLNAPGISKERLTTSEENPTRIPMRPGLLDELQLRGLRILKEVQNVSAGLAVLFNEENTKSMSEALRNIGKAVNKWEKTPEKLDPTLDEIRQAVKSFNELAAELKELSHNANTFMANDMNNDAVPRLEALTEEANKTLTNLNEVLEQYKQRPTGLLFGAQGPAPGPGESGFSGGK